MHTSNAPISSAIRMTSSTSTLTGMYRCHLCTSALVITRKANRVILFDGNKFGHWLVKNLATWTTRECRINGGTRDHNRDVGRTLRHGLFRHAWLSIRLKVRRMVQRLISVLELRLGSIDLERMMSEFSFIRNFRANHLGSNLRLGAEAQFVHHAVQMSRQRFVLQFQRLRPQLRPFHPLFQGINIGPLPIDPTKEFHWGQRGCYPGGKLRVF